MPLMLTASGHVSSYLTITPPATPYATRQATANLSRSSGAPPIPAFARDREIRIDKRDWVVVAPARDTTRHGVTIITDALLLALAVCVGWFAGLNSESFFIKPASLSVEKVTSSADPT